MAFSEGKTSNEKTEKPNCYECKHRGPVPGSAHSSCNLGSFEDLIIFDCTKALSLGIKAELHGVKNGWFNWPIDFDPVWLSSCNGFEKK